MIFRRPGSLTSVLESSEPFPEMRDALDAVVEHLSSERWAFPVESIETFRRTDGWYARITFAS
jgi:hypothetical protein